MPDPVNGEHPTGAFAVFRCNNEYMRTGTLVSICQDLGNWEPDIPTCDKGIAMYTIFSNNKILFTFSKKYSQFHVYKEKHRLCLTVFLQ